MTGLDHIDRTAFSVNSLGDDPGDKEYRLSKSPQERLAAREHMRQVACGCDPTTARRQRVFEGGC